MKFLIKKIIGENKNSRIYSLSSKFYKKYSPYITIITNMVYDTYFFSKHSNIFSINKLNKIEAKIILDYHSIEKGLLFPNIKYGFGKEKIVRLHKLLKNREVLKYSKKSQIQTAYSVLCEYFELHKENSINISKFFSDEDYLFYKKTLSSFYDPNFKGFYEFSKQEYFQHRVSSFDLFSESRKSVRNFSENKIDDILIEKAVALSKNAPSVCNRQSAKVYYVKNKNKIDEILKLQSGLTGFSKDIKQLLVITTDVNYFYSVGERYQFYIDGGIYLMNLLYALHFYNIAACPANWAKERDDEKKLKQTIPIQKSEKVICVIAIGEAAEQFRTTLSKRRETNELLTIIEN